ncbi:MAG: hypothetical protein ACP5E4_02645 [Candidatus Aenigmatarchaeota archaeon]
MKMQRKNSLMDPEGYREIEGLLLFFAVSFLFFSGFYTIYYSGVSLVSVTQLSAQLFEKVVAAACSSGMKAFFLLGLQPLCIAVFSLVIFSLGLSLLSVKSPGRLKYALAVPILLSGVLFNFSVPFLFFGAGLFAASLYAIPLGQTYAEELKRWKSFRIGSNAVGKALLILSLFAFVGVYLELSGNDSYAEIFRYSVIDSVSVIVEGELDNMAPAQNMSAAGSAVAVEAVVRSSIEESPIVSTVIAWFPLIMGFTVFASLELLRSLLLAPLAGVFSAFWLFVLKHAPYKGSGNVLGAPEAAGSLTREETAEGTKHPENAEIKAIMAELKKEEDVSGANTPNSAP